MPYKLVAFDMDGVLFTHKNFWLELHKILGTHKEGAALTRKYLKTDYARLVREVPGRLWKGKDSKPYFELVASMAYEPHAKEVLIELKKRGYTIAVISSGPKHAALRLQEECGIDHFHTHDLVVGKDGRFTGEYRYEGWWLDKTAQLKEFCENAGCTMKEAVFVGHDENDILALQAAGFGIAYRAEQDEVNAASDLAIDDLRQLLGILR